MPASEPVEDFEALLGFLKRNRGFDFSAYKRASLMRRIEKRMQALNIASCRDYQDYLEVHPDEFPELFNTILINVTAFFRDPDAWNYLANEIIPRILKSKGPHDPIRVWSAGCASGEEPYTAAILFADALGQDAFAERVKIYASNVDEDALNKARLATYTDHEVQSLPKEYLQKYFQRVGQQWVLQKELRRAVIFGRHDLLQDAPISRVDLLICRNTLMYFNSEAQSRILARFHFALNDEGYLFLGKAEMLLSHAGIITPVDLKRRVFVKATRANMRDRLLVMTQAGRDEGPHPPSNHVRLREAAFEVDPVAQIVTDISGNLILANEAARALFVINSRDLGRPIGELEIAFRPTDLETSIDRAYADRHALVQKGIEWPVEGNEGRMFDLQMLPLLDTNGGALGVKIIYSDTTSLVRQAQEAEVAKQDLETAREELQTTSEELQSTIEELETTNEELQSTNEELETMNEELQSTNEELRTMNDELAHRGDDLNEVNGFLESILTSLRAAVVVVDRDLHVLIWNHKAEDLWGLRTDEAESKHLLNLDIGFPVDKLRQPLRLCLSGEKSIQELVVDATNRRGKTIECRVVCTPLIGLEKEIRGAILLMEDGKESSAHPLAE